MQKKIPVATGLWATRLGWRGERPRPLSDAGLIGGITHGVAAEGNRRDAEGKERFGFVLKVTARSLKQLHEEECQEKTKLLRAFALK